LQRHFDVVIEILLASTQHSITTAVARLEAQSDHTWSGIERDRCYQRLLAARRVQLQRLAAYRDRGVFPVNPGYTDQPVPIFVDMHDTACAVGQLMRWDNWESEVDTIRSQNNFVYVPDAARSAVAEWVAFSGLTIEEAALVQPAYAGPPPTTTLGSLLPQDSFIDFNGLRFSHFSVKRETGEGYLPPFFSPNTSPACNLVPDSSLCVPTFKNPVEIFAPDANPIGISLGSGVFASPQLGSIKILPYGTQWMFIGAAYGASGLGIDGSGPGAQRLTLGFQVETIDPNARLNKLVLGMSGLMGGLIDFNNGRIDTIVAGSAVDVPGYGVIPIDKLGFANMDSFVAGFDSGSFVNDAFEFNGRQSIYVQTRGYINDFPPLNGFVLHFNVVPEPSSTTLIAVCLGTLSMRRKRVV